LTTILWYYDTETNHFEMLENFRANRFDEDSTNQNVNLQCRNTIVRILGSIVTGDSPGERPERCQDRMVRVNDSDRYGRTPQ